LFANHHNAARGAGHNEGVARVRMGEQRKKVGIGNGLVRDGFFCSQTGVGADLQLCEFFFAGWVALA
jgi:hypothetical protein